MNAPYKELISIKSDTVFLEAALELPENPIGIVAFAHGSGSNRMSSRNNYIAEQLHQARIATLLLDLLTKSENHTDPTRFNIKLLTMRLNAVCHWIEQTRIIAKLPLGLFGSSTGAAAVLQVAATHSKGIAAIVSRSGRLDLASHNALRSVYAPTLLIVGGHDYSVIDVNRHAYFLLSCKKRLEIITGASHLFEEPGTLEKVSELAVAWFLKYLPPAPQ
ncbi:pimeloyl-ACP methyl ester carboxylesterase [Oxalobacteraceae bacterium GrIS 2.11]